MDLELNSDVDLTALIHRGGVLFDVEGDTPEAIYEKISNR